MEPQQGVDADGAGSVQGMGPREKQERCGSKRKAFHGRPRPIGERCPALTWLSLVGRLASRNGSGETSTAMTGSDLETETEMSPASELRRRSSSEERVKPGVANAASGQSGQQRLIRMVLRPLLDAHNGSESPDNQA